jgi:hypothetical protein
MALHDAAIERIVTFVAEADRRNELNVLPAAEPWPEGDSFFLAEQCACEPGHPAAGSLHAVVWADRDDIGRGRVWSVGPRLADLAAAPSALALVVLLRAGDDAEPYEQYVAYRDALHELELDGLIVRTLPAGQSIWCRVQETALAAGRDFPAWGAAIIAALGDVPGVRGADVLFVTGEKDALAPLAEPVTTVARTIAALRKMSREMDFECDKCEYWDVCEAVAELKRLRRKRQGDSRG